jgi:hypothetical protein
MARTLLTALAVMAGAAAAAASPAASAAVPSGALYGVFRTDSGCALVSVSPSTGVNKTVASVSICDGIDSLFPSYAVHDAKRGALVVAIQAAASIFRVDLATGAATAVVPMPTYNSSDFLLGLQLLGDTLYLVSQGSVWSAPAGGAPALTDLGVPAAFPQYAQVAATPGGGTRGAPRLFIADENSKTMFVVDLGAPGNAVGTLTTGVGNTILLRYSNATKNGAAFVELASYRLYLTDPGTGKTTSLGAVPDGPGYPRVNAVSPDGTTFAIIDFANVFTMSLANGAVGPAFPFTGAPRVVGFPAWIPA